MMHRVIGSGVIDPGYTPLTVSEELDPDVTGTYHVVAVRDGYPIWERDAGSWWIWWDASAHNWYLSAEIDNAVGEEYAWWEGPNTESPIWWYDAGGTASGEATVS